MTRPIRATTTSSAPPEEVWKLLHDPTRFGGWWHGVEDTELDEDGRVLFHREDGAVMPSLLTTDVAAGHVVVSCLELDVRYEWVLDALDDGGTSITAHCNLSEREAARWHIYRAAVALSLRRLAELAQSATAAPRARG